MQQQIDDIIDFWFGELSEAGSANEEHRARWWKKDLAFDTEIRERFGTTVAAAASGDLVAWRRSTRGQFAMILLIDQFRRNIFRDLPAAWSEDSVARELSRELINSGRITDLPEQYHYFALMPLMHGETIDSQDECVKRFDDLAAAASSEPLKDSFEDAAKYARMHREIIVRFGRFPHRNRIMGRSSTAEEIEFLETPGSSF